MVRSFQIKIQKRKLIQAKICIRQKFQFVSLEMRESNFSSPLINNWLLFYAIKRSKKHLGFTIVGFKYGSGHRVGAAGIGVRAAKGLKNG